MSEKAGRKKQPQVIRKQLLDVTAKIILEQGLAAVTLDKVAAAAGVSKGGLLHRFHSKTSLIEALLIELYNEFEAGLEQIEAEDKLATGRRTRAVLRMVDGLKDHSGTQLWATLTFEVRHNEELSDRCRNFLHETLAKDCQRKDEEVALAIVSLAADGLSLADASGVFAQSPALRKKIVKQLEAITKNPTKLP